MSDPIAALFIDIRGRIDGLQKDMEEAGNILEGTAKKIEGFTGKIQDLIEAAFLVTGVEAVRKFNEAILDLAGEGDRLLGISSAFESLGGSAESIEAAKAATLGMVDATDL